MAPWTGPKNSPKACHLSQDNSSVSDPTDFPSQLHCMTLWLYDRGVCLGHLHQDMIKWQAHPNSSPMKPFQRCSQPPSRKERFAAAWRNEQHCMIQTQPDSWSKITFHHTHKTEASKRGSSFRWSIVMQASKTVLLLRCKVTTTSLRKQT